MSGRTKDEIVNALRAEARQHRLNASALEAADCLAGVALAEQHAALAGERALAMELGL